MCDRYNSDDDPTGRDLALLRAFDAGNYGEAYDGFTPDASLEKWVSECRAGFDHASDWTPDNQDRAAFLLGYFATYTRTECGEWLDEYDAALASVGADLIRLGRIDGPCDEHDRDDDGTCVVCNA